MEQSEKKTMTWLEDMHVGAEAQIGDHRFKEDAMIDFAKRYDPRDYYIRAEAANHGPFGRLAASPWYVSAIWMRSMMNSRNQDFFNQLSDRRPDSDQARVGPSPGFLEMTWPHPVYADDEITFFVKVHELIKLKSKPEWGIARNLNTGYNQRGECVLRFFGQILMERRKADMLQTHKNHYKNGEE